MLPPIHAIRLPLFTPLLSMIRLLVPAPLLVSVGTPCPILFFFEDIEDYMVSRLRLGRFLDVMVGLQQKSRTKKSRSFGACSER